MNCNGSKPKKEAKEFSNTSAQSNGIKTQNETY